MFQKLSYTFETGFLENRVSKHGHFRNSFEKWDKMLDFLCKMSICPF